MKTHLQTAFEVWADTTFKREHNFTMEGGRYADPVVRELFQHYVPGVAGKAAIYTLEALRYTYHGGNRWKPPMGEQMMHTKTKKLYRVTGKALLQTDKPLSDNAPVVVYQGLFGDLWVRDEGEFQERFERTSNDSAN